jgi:hypothetical protein
VRVAAANVERCDLGPALLRSCCEDKLLHSWFHGVYPHVSRTRSLFFTWQTIKFGVWRLFYIVLLIVSETAEESGVHPSMSLVSTKSYWPQADVYGEKMMVYESLHTFQWWLETTKSAKQQNAVASWIQTSLRPVLAAAWEFLRGKMIKQNVGWKMWFFFFFLRGQTGVTHTYNIVPT